MGLGPKLRTRTSSKGSTAGGGLRVQSLEVRPWVEVWGQGLGSAQLEGASAGEGLDLGPQQAPQGPRRQGKCWPHSLLILCSPKGLCLSLLIPSLWVGPSERGNPSPLPAAAQGCWSHPASTSPSCLPPPPHPTLPVTWGFLPSP